MHAHKDVLVILATSPAGLGHIRVMAALREGLSGKIPVVEVGITDTFIQEVHRVTSRNVALRRVMEFVQHNGVAETIFSRSYVARLRQNFHEAFHRIVDVVARQRPKPTRLVIVATHFGLAHQLAQVKGELERTTRTTITLAVVVTDDSPQRVWAVWGADVIFCPSLVCHDGLLEQFARMGLVAPEIVVSPYPVSGALGVSLKQGEYRARLKQLVAGRAPTFRLMVPISGAAVGLDFYQEMVSTLHAASGVEVVVVARESKHTHAFLDWAANMKRVRVVASEQDRLVVESYRQELVTQVYGVEVTKPSEQAFKALLTPGQRGGVILLFSEPVGRQEYDNLAFLRRHGLIPGQAEEAVLFNLFASGQTRLISDEVRLKARKWRGVVLPKKGWQAAAAILYLKKTGILENMGQFEGFKRVSGELSDRGVRRVWERVL